MNMNQKKPSRKPSRKSSTSPQRKKGLSIVMPNSEHLEQKSPNLEATPTQNSHTLYTSTITTPHTIISTKSPLTQEQPKSRLEAMNPAGEQTVPLPPPTPTSERSVADKPPKDVKPAGGRAGQSVKQLTNDLAGLYASIGLIVSSGDTYTGVLLMTTAEKRAEELVNVARHHPKMMKVLKQLTTSNDYITLIMGHGMMAYAILAHFNRVPQTPIIAAMGFSEAQVLAPPPGMGNNGSNLDAANRQYAAI